MNDDNLDELIENLLARTPSYEVRIDKKIDPGVATGDAHEAASAVAQARLESLSRGDRVVHVITNGRETFSDTVNRSQVNALIASGAIHDEASALAAFAEADAPAARG